MHSFRAVVFDFDGTLADSYEAITASVNYVRTTYGLPPLAEREVRRHVGRGLDLLLRDLVPDADPQAAVACYRAHHPSVMTNGTRLLPGVAATIAELHRAGFALAVCSNKLAVFTEQLLKALGLAAYLETVVGPEHVVQPKPAPDMLQLALARLDVSPEEALYIGDMTVDIETARAANVTVWVVPTGSDSRNALAAARPDRLLDHFAELAALVR